MDFVHLLKRGAFCCVWLCAALALFAQNADGVTDDAPESLAGSLENLPAQPESLRPPKLPIGIETRETPLVEKYRKDYLSNFGKQWITGALESGAAYRAYAREKIAEKGLPACLEYLPLIESEYKPAARSRTGALGLWQFMENSIAPYLQKTRFADERLDPWKATDAALAKLEENYKRFGDWTLALAAYNSGAGAVQRALERSSEKNYWALCEKQLLREESVRYIPKFLAICDVIINQEYFDVSFPALSDSDKADFVFFTAEKPVIVSAFYGALNIEKENFLFLNPALLFDMAPQGWIFRIPPDALESAESAFNEALAADVHIVEKGETLWGISRRYGVTVDELCEVNHIDEKAILPIGKILVVPIHK